ncbi:MAG: peptidylprolyl isomerase [Isosphaeraceae bacterium]
MRRSLILLALFLGLGALAAPQSASAADDNPIVVIDTSMGKITVELDAKNAPKSTENFLKYVDARFYDGLVFHRVIPGFMIQGGGFDGGLKQKEEGVRAPIRNENGNGLKNERGTIAMARTSAPDSATCQFFINHADNHNLDRPPGYAVFGKVIDGMDVVDKIADVRTTTRRAVDGLPLQNCPVELPVIKSIRRKDKS